MTVRHLNSQHLDPKAMLLSVIEDAHEYEYVIVVGKTKSGSFDKWSSTSDNEKIMDAAGRLILIATAVIEEER